MRNPQKCSRNFNTGNSENPITSTHIGCIEFKSTTNKSTITIENVYYCPQTSVNVLSLQSLLLNLEASAKFKDKECVLLHGGKKLMVATLESDHLYAVSSHTPDESNDNKILSLSYSRNINYWHSLLGHLHPKAIIEMAKHNLVDGMPTDLSMQDWKSCPTCAQGKSTKRKRKRRDEKGIPPRQATLPGDSWHSDQKGPINPQSAHGNRYSILFVDEHTGYTEVFHLSSLDQTQETYEKHRKRVQTLFNRNIKRLICDGHSTYKSMITTLEQEGTTITFRAPYDPNGNALAERTIRTIFEMARTMMVASGLPQNRWEEAVDHAVWIRNRVKTVRLNNITPFEAYFRMKPDLRHLHPFGCLAHALIPKETRKKTFDPITRRCVFMGFSKHHDAFLLFDTDRKKEVVSRDVLFFDDTFPLVPEPFSSSSLSSSSSSSSSAYPSPSSSPSPSPSKCLLTPNIGRHSLRSYVPNMEATSQYSGICGTGGETFDKGDGGADKMETDHTQDEQNSEQGEKKQHTPLVMMLSEVLLLPFPLLYILLLPTVLFHLDLPLHHQKSLPSLSLSMLSLSMQWKIFLTLLQQLMKLSLAPIKMSG